MPIGTLAPMFLAVAGCVAAVWLVLSPGRRGSNFRAAGYCAKPLLTRWELAALRELRRDLPHGFHACTQVRLADVVELVEGKPTRHHVALYRVSSKSVDFVIIDLLARVEACRRYRPAGR